MTLAFLTLFSALSLASVTEWFSIIGFMAIYAGAPMHALIMGLALGAGKLVTTSWLYRNWKFSNWRLKTPLVIFTATLMIVTSIGVFGFLSKAHLEQGASTIDNSAKVERLDQQIAREKSTIADDEKVIAQLDATINSYIGKDRTDKSLAVRKSQTPQRNQLRDDITASQKRIDGFSDEKLKLQSEVRQQQLDVGPIRYIAELFYGVEQDANKNIEAAVRMFTLLIVSTLDPLAVILLIAANHTLMRLKDEKENKIQETNINQRYGSDRSTTTVKESTGAEDTEVAPKVVEERMAEKLSESEYIQSDPIHNEILPEVIDNSINEETSYIQEPNEGSEDSIRLVIPDKEEVSRVNGENFVETTTTGTLPTVQEEFLDEEETPVLETFELPAASAPFPIIRSPSLTRVSSRPVATSQPSTAPTSVDQEIQGNKDSVAPVPEVVPPQHSSIFRELLGSASPHFIPQKVNEEEKFTGVEEASTTAKTAAPPSEEIETVLDKGSVEGKEASILPTTRKVSVFGDSSNKYPKALSWLTEFKR